MLRPQIFIRAKKLLSLTNAALIGDGGPLYNFFSIADKKIGLKCSENFEAKEKTSWNFAKCRAAKWG